MQKPKMPETISSGKAIFIDDEGNPVESKAGDNEDSDDTTPKLIPLITAF